MSIHIHRVPTKVISVRENGEPRWCFRCRKRVPFIITTSVPIDPMSYYGPNASIKCEPRGHLDGDCFPGTFREWE